MLPQPSARMAPHEPAPTPAAVSRLQLPVGPAVSADITVAGQSGHLLATVVGDRVYELLCITAGSPAAERGWSRIVDSVTLAR